MHEDAAGIWRVILAYGYVDLRKGLDGLSMIDGDKYRQNPCEKSTFFLILRPKSRQNKRLIVDGQRITAHVQEVRVRFLLVAKDNRRSRRPYGGTVPLPNAGAKSPRSEDQRGHTEKVS